MGGDVTMTIESFNLLDEHQKIQLVFDADKVSEKVDDEANYQLFKIDNFYIEARTSLEGKFKRTFSYYTLKNLPAYYLSEVLSIPIVTNNSDKKNGTVVNADFRNKKATYSRVR